MNNKLQLLRSIIREEVQRHLKEGAEPGDKFKHKHLPDLEIELISPTNRGWKVYQYQKRKRKIAYFDREDIMGARALFEPINLKEQQNMNLKKLIKENSVDDFNGTGLIVVGRTQIDNNEIQDVIDDSDFHGIWNAREGYWFFPEEEWGLYDLEKELDTLFSKHGINARFEGQFN